ncbi:hypothetical protein BGX28_009202 [Mortierella sp. GBA30]|nr:hypothetical protein BGX28_009202 [Mortierella sp. GBA30]
MFRNEAGARVKQPHSSLGHTFATKTTNVHPTDRSNNGDVIVVNSDIMILPVGQQESQTEEEVDTADDDDTLSSSGRGGRDSNSHVSGDGSPKSYYSTVESPSNQNRHIPQVVESVPSKVSGDTPLSTQPMASYSYHRPDSQEETKNSMLAQQQQSVSQVPSAVSFHIPTLPTTKERSIPEAAATASDPTHSTPQQQLPAKRSIELQQFQQPTSTISTTSSSSHQNKSSSNKRHSAGSTENMDEDMGPARRSRDTTRGKNTQEHATTRERSYGAGRTERAAAKDNNANNDNNKSTVNNTSDALIYNVSRDATDTHIPSRSGRSSLLGRLAPSNSKKAALSRGKGGPSGLPMDTPESQNATRNKNNVVRHRHQQQHLHLRNDVDPEKQNQTSPYRKTGVPGKNGEEPETDLFNFVDIMLDMPERPTWSVVVNKLAKVLLVMTVSYFGLMALYFGAEFQSDARMKNFDIMVVDLDQAMIGIQYLNYTRMLNKQPGQPNWSIQDATLYPNMSSIQDEVRSGQFWGAVVVQPNASANLNMAYAYQYKAYDPTQAFAFIYDGGRDPLVVKPHIVANMYTQFLQFSKLFNPLWVQFVLGYSATQNFNVTTLSRSPQVMGTPIAFEEFDLHPLSASIITSATSVAYIWIFLVAGGSTYLVAHIIQPMTRQASVARTVAMLLLPLLVFLTVLSMAYSILLLAFGVPFPDGVTQFLSLFAGMLMLQCAVASMVLFLIYLIPVVFIPSITITFVVLNVIAVFNPVELMAPFYRWVYAMPFLNAVQIARYVLMGSYNRLQYNLPILAAWIMIPIALLPFAIMRRKRISRELAIQEHDEEEEKEMETEERRRVDPKFHRMEKGYHQPRSQTKDRGEQAFSQGGFHEGVNKDDDDSEGDLTYLSDEYPQREASMETHERRAGQGEDRVQDRRRRSHRDAELGSSSAHRKRFGDISDTLPGASAESQALGRTEATPSSWPRQERDLIPQGRTVNWIPDEVKE